jgi:hypothetical protein
MAMVHIRLRNDTKVNVQFMLDYLLKFPVGRQARDQEFSRCQYLTFISAMMSNGSIR